MISKRLGFLVLALIVTLVVVLLVRRLLTTQEAKAESRLASPIAAHSVEAAVLVAATTLPAGSVLGISSVRWQPWPRTNLSEAYVVEGAAKMSTFVGGVLRARVTAGEPLTRDIVSRVGQGGSLAEVLTPGARAITINLSPSSGMAGFVRPGDRVDLILSTSHPSVGKDGQSVHVGETLLTDLRVVGMDQSLSDDVKTDKADKKDVAVPKTATLEVTPKQAELVALASDLGVLSLSLRSLANPGYEPAVAPTRYSAGSPSSAAGAVTSRPRSARVARAMPFTVNVYRGGVNEAAAPALATKAPT
jgi:pilus assembly protein CpaB